MKITIGGGDPLSMAVQQHCGSFHTPFGFSEPWKQVTTLQPTSCTLATWHWFVLVSLRLLELLAWARRFGSTRPSLRRLKSVSHFSANAIDESATTANTFCCFSAVASCTD